MNENALVTIISLFAIMCALLMLSACNTISPVNETKELEITSETDVYMDFPSVDLKIATIPDGETPYVTYSLSVRSLVDVDANDFITVLNDNNDLNIEVSSDFLTTISDCNVALYLPEAGVRSLKLKLTSGKGTISGISANSVSINSTSGTFTFEDIESKTLQVETTSGTIKFFGTVSDSVWVDVTSGLVDISNTVVPQDYYCDLTSGNVKLRIPDGGFKLKYHITTGAIVSDYIESSEIAAKNGTADYGDASANFEVEVTSGTVEILKLAS